MDTLVEKKCIPCRGGVPPISEPERTRLLSEVSRWQLIEKHHLQKSYSFANFADALEFVNRVGEIAEAEAHHPDIYLAWGKVEIQIWTHKIDNLTESDFILAAKIDAISN